MYYVIGYIDFTTNKLISHSTLYDKYYNANWFLEELIYKILLEQYKKEISYSLDYNEMKININNNENLLIIKNNNIIDIYLNSSKGLFNFFGNDKTTIIYKFYITKHIIENYDLKESFIKII